MILHDTEIRHRLPQFFPDHHEALVAANRVGPASVDLTVTGPLLGVGPVEPGWPIRPGVTTTYEVPLTPGRAGEPAHWVIRPGKLYLISCTEWVTIPNGLSADVTGRSSWGRCGLLVHVTAGFGDPGFSGDITLELASVGPDIELRPGDSICQIIFKMNTGMSDRPYGAKSKYQGQRGVTPARALDKGMSR